MALCDRRLLSRDTGLTGTQRDSSCGVWPSTAPTQLSRDIELTGTQRDSSCGVWPSTAPTQLSRDIGLTGTQQVAMAQALRGITGSYTPGAPWGGSSKGSLGV
ncbi:unnamed protein product [Staurois parvus]|uniref:Uncharacterized protein n=1 Tax=Staurois parvus TaxID=386267 RepID=A0ABN9GIB9_9NEOB|nr:unnamed protein product [Staurois parvus]